MGSWLISSLYISLQPVRLPRSLPCTLRLLSYRYATPTGRMTETNEGMNRPWDKRSMMVPWYTVNLDLRVLTAPLSLRSSVTPVGHLHPSFLTVRTSLVPRSVTPVGKDERSEDDPREKERVE